MGDKQVIDTENEGDLLRAFTKRLLRDVQALERMLKKGMIEEGVRRIGAEQEVFLVDRDFRPATTALKMIERLHDEHYVTEVALFNLEMNLDPQPFAGTCLSDTEAQLLGLLDKARHAAHAICNEIVLTGIPPTIRKSAVCI